MFEQLMFEWVAFKHRLFKHQTSKYEFWSIYVQMPQARVWAHYISTLVLFLPDHRDMYMNNSIYGTLSIYVVYFCLGRMLLYWSMGQYNNNQKCWHVCCQLLEEKEILNIMSVWILWHSDFGLSMNGHYRQLHRILRTHKKILKNFWVLSSNFWFLSVAWVFAASSKSFTACSFWSISDPNVEFWIAKVELVFFENF